MEIALGGRFHRLAQIVGAGLLETIGGIELPQAVEERLVADEAPQHMQHRRALVVDERAEYFALALDVAKAIPEVDRTLIRILDCPAAELAEHVAERLFTAALL